MVKPSTNAVRHAHKNLPRETPIQIEVNLTREQMEIRIWDRGEYFDLSNFIATIAKQDNKWLARGRGIPIMNKIADRIEYNRFGNERNCLLIVKKFQVH